MKKGPKPGFKLSEKTKEKIRKAKTGVPNLLMRGERHPCWKGGVTPVYKKIRKSPEYKLWRTAVFERDDYSCVWCGYKNGNGKSIPLNADHIKPFSLYPELRFAIDNGRTLCVDCHRKTDTYGQYKR